MIKTIKTDKKVPFSTFFYFICWITSFLSFYLPFTVSFLSTLDKSKLTYHSKQYGPFIDFRRSLPAKLGELSSQGTEIGPQNCQIEAQRPRLATSDNQC